MRLRSSTSRQHRLWPFGLGLAIAIVCLCLPLRAQLKRMPTLKDFKIIDYFSREELSPGQSNQVKNVFTGAEAQPRPGGLVLVREMRIQNFRPNGTTNFIVRTPECVFNYEDRTAQSTGRIELVSGDGRFQLSGREGFYCRPTNTLIIVSNCVRTEMRFSPSSSTKP